jgi:hypothetical protein
MVIFTWITLLKRVFLLKVDRSFIAPLSPLYRPFMELNMKIAEIGYFYHDRPIWHVCLNHVMIRAIQSPQAPQAH